MPTKPKFCVSDPWTISEKCAMMRKKGGYCYACFRRTSACGCVGLFETLCAIPHGSRDTKAISDYCVRFAQERGLSWQQDASNNVIIRKPASPGYEDHPTVILQGHLDMVCEKDADCDIDFAKDGLRLRHDDTYIFADGTTLGGDDGIAVAYALAVLDSDTLKHPPLEAVFTVDEEIGHARRGSSRYERPAGPCAAEHRLPRTRAS